MTVLEVYSQLKNSQYNLSKASIYEALSFVTNKDYEWIINHQKTEIADLNNYQILLTSLNQGLPLPYILKKKKFHQTDFYVDNRVLIPRIETEILIEEAFLWLSNNPEAKILDLGTGSGILGLTLKKHFSNTEVYLSDISASALEVAKINAHQQSLQVHYLIGDFLTPVIEKKLKFDLIICNPPYIAFDDPDLEFSTSFEPSQALFAQDNGLEFYHKILQNLPLIVNNQSNFCLIMEFGWKQKEELTKLIANYLNLDFWDIKFQKDYSNFWRCIIIKGKY